MTRLTIILVLTVLCWAAPALADPPVEGTLWPSPVVVATYQGHTAQWWAQRSRQAHRHVRHLQAALRERLPLTGGLATAFLCIHRFEGSWTDGGAPFWGGLQMDYGFASTYGGEFLRAWGTPDHWPPFIQAAVAMRAYLTGRGFHPWPNTARACGLL